jgi:hypothetical protein
MNKNPYLIGGLVVMGVVVIASVGYSWSRSGDDSAQEEKIEEDTELVATITEETLLVPKQRANVPTRKTAPTVTDDEKYQQAFNTYKNAGAYFQFKNCKGNPGSIVLKQNLYFMLDNRDKVARTIGVGDTSYIVPAEGYRVVQAKTIGLNYITCNGGGAARITIQE